MTPELRERIRQLSERSLAPEEARVYLETPVSDEERSAVLEQVRWFTRRYPAPLDRLAYVTRAFKRWALTEPPIR